MPLGMIKVRDVTLFSHSKNVMAKSKEMSVIFSGIQATQGEHTLK
jgi:hypothetical protein